MTGELYPLMVCAEDVVRGDAGVEAPPVDLIMKGTMEIDGEERPVIIRVKSLKWAEDSEDAA